MHRNIHPTSQKNFNSKRVVLIRAPNILGDELCSPAVWFQSERKMNILKYDLLKEFKIYDQVSHVLIFIIQSFRSTFRIFMRKARMR